MKNNKKWQVIDLPKIQDSRGNLTFVEGNNIIPFDIKRVYWLFDVPGGESRAGHAHKKLKQLLIAVSGSFDIHLDDGKTQEIISLNRSYIGLLIESGVWRVIDNFSGGAVCLALASMVYDEKDYYREYKDFLKAVKKT